MSRVAWLRPRNEFHSGLPNVRSNVFSNKIGLSWTALCSIFELRVFRARKGDSRLFVLPRIECSRRQAGIRIPSRRYRNSPIDEFAVGNRLRSVAKHVWRPNLPSGSERRPSCELRVDETTVLHRAFWNHPERFQRGTVLKLEYNSSMRVGDHSRGCWPR